MSSISGVPPISAYLPQAVLPIQPTAPTTVATQGADNNNITINSYNEFNPQTSDISNLLIANEVQVTGSDNNITINEYNIVNPAGQTDSPSILPQQNADGTITLNAATPADTINNFIAQEMQLLTSLYQKANNIPSSDPSTTDIIV